MPIVPGIMPITNIEQLERFVRHLRRDRADAPGARSWSGTATIRMAVVQLGVAHATVQCMELLSRGVPGIHFYT